MTVLLFARYPRAGRVKTRLTPPLDPGQACRLYRAFLLDTVQSMLSHGDDVVPVVLVSDIGDVDAMRATLAEEGYAEVAVHPQSNAELGVRLNDAFDQAFQWGASKVCALGTDHPTLPASRISDANRLLDRADVVLCPAEDGGYCMIAARRPVPSLLLDMPYTTSSLSRMVKRRAQEDGLDLVELPVWYDVDDAAGLIRLANDINLAGERTRRVWGAIQKERGADVGE